MQCWCCILRSSFIYTPFASASKPSLSSFRTTAARAQPDPWLHGHFLNVCAARLYARVYVVAGMHKLAGTDRYTGRRGRGTQIYTCLVSATATCTAHAPSLARQHALIKRRVAHLTSAGRVSCLPIPSFAWRVLQQKLVTTGIRIIKTAGVVLAKARVYLWCQTRNNSDAASHCLARSRWRAVSKCEQNSRQSFK